MDGRTTECYQCQSETTGTKDTRRNFNTGEVTRQRYCRDCGASWLTVEARIKNLPNVFGPKSYL